MRTPADLGATRQLSRARQLATLVVTCIGFFMVLLDASIVTVALPTIQVQLHAQLADLQWVVDAYTLPFAVLLLTMGTLGDRFGRKRVFLGGLTIFCIGSAVCGLAPNLGSLLAGRVLQGVGGAALSPGSLSVLAAAFPEPRARTRAISIWSGISGIALAAGPLTGGFLIQAAGWQSIFFVNLPIGLAALLLGLPILMESRNPAARRLDLPGQILAIGALSAVTYGLIEGNSRGWSSSFILGLFGLAAMLLLVFLVVEARRGEPMLPLGLFKSGILSTANLAALVVGFALLGTVFFVAQYFQEVQGYSALGSGLRTLPNTVGIFVTAPFAGWLTTRFGPRLPVTLGALCSATALLLLTRLEPATPYADIWWNLALLGIGFGLMLSPLTATVLAATPPTRAGLASSLVNTSRQIGSVLGIAVLGAVVQGGFADNLAAGLTSAALSPDTSATIAQRVAPLGANAANPSVWGAIPLAPQAIHDLVALAFTDSLHAAFTVSGTALFCTALLALLLLGRPRRESELRSAPVSSEKPLELTPVDVG
jgi:DHA2 family methylenomycin A resistance protein-like MFS transporter